MSYSNIQEWVDGFSSLENFSRVSIDTWYKMRPPIKSYPETFSAIRPGFDDSIIDNAIITLAIENDDKKVDFAKNNLVERMKQYFSAEDVGVVSLDSALSQDREQTQAAANTVPASNGLFTATAGTEVPTNQPTAEPGAIGPSKNYSSDDAEGLINYIAEKHKLDTNDVSGALQDMSSQPYPMSRVMINNFLCNRYNFPITNDGEITSRISEYLNSHIDIKDSMKDKLDIAKNVVNQFFPADNFLVMDILNVYMDPSLTPIELPQVLNELLRTSGLAIPDGVVNQMIVALSDNIRRYDMEIAEKEGVANFARRDAIEILNQVCKDHRLKLAANEIKWIYDSFLENKLDERKTAQVLQGIKTESGRPLLFETAVDILKEFRERVRAARVTDGFVVFAHKRSKNFNKIVESAFELSNLAAQVGIDDRFIIDNYDELASVLMDSESTEQLLSNLAGFMLEKGYAQDLQEATLIAQDFAEVLRDSDWAKQYMPLKNFARNDLISRMFSLGYSERDIAIKLHEPVARVRNFAGGWLDTFVDNLSRDPGLSWMTPDTQRNSKEPDRYSFVLRLVQVLLAAGFTIKFILPHLKEFYYALTNHQKTDAEKYAEIKQIVEENQRYRQNGDRAAQALLQMQGMFAGSANPSALGLTKSMYGGF